MSSYKGHILFALILLGMFTYITKPILNSDYLILLLIVIIYSILPDIDIPGSIARKGFTALGLIGILFSIIYFEKTSEPLSAAIAGLIILLLLFLNVVHHRGMIHTHLAGMILALPLIPLLGTEAFLLAYLAYASHLLLDGEFLKILTNA